MQSSKADWILLSPFGAKQVKTKFYSGTTTSGKFSYVTKDWKLENSYKKLQISSGICLKTALWFKSSFFFFDEFLVRVSSMLR